MMNFNDIFKPEDLKKIEEKDKKVKEIIDLTGDIARTCLNMEQFKRYKEQYKKASSTVLDAMLLLTNAYESGRLNGEAYAMKTLVYMTKLKAIKLLMDNVESDSRKGKIQND